METSVIEEIMEGIREKEIKEKDIGYVVGVNGPVVIGREMSGCVMYELVRIGPKGLIGEVIRIKNNTAIIQVYEETSGLGVDDIIIREGRPLRVELGPGLYENIFDGIQRPLDEIKEKTGGYYIPRGIKLPSLSHTRDYCFIPRRQKGDVVGPGDIIGEVQENSLKTTKILIPPKSRGRIAYIAEEGFYTHEDVIAELEGEEINEEIFLFHSWPVRIPRPVKCRFDSTEPVFTGQRVLDTLFPCAKGGTIAIPGAFGCGKTVISHALSKHSNSDSIVYVGCGERGNEISEVLRDFPKLCIGKTGESIMKRTVLVANTSNMPVAAREASIYTGITIAEYFRDQGMDVTMMADSTSRWAEALREISGRLAEMPADSGYPAYLSARLSMFYERAGAVNCLGSPDRIGSVTIVGAVSPPGGDFSDPVTAATLGIVKVFWGLDKRLAQRKHFPSINVSKSYSRCKDRLESFYASMFPDFLQHRSTCYEILHKESKIFEIVQLVGRNAISEDEKLYMDIAKVIREDFLQQNGYSSYDASCPLEKTAKMLENIVLYFNSAIERIKKSNNTWESILERTDKSFQAIKRMKFIEIDGKMSRRLDEVKNLILYDFASLS